MASLTLTVDADLLKRARISALARGMSVEALVLEYLEELAGQHKAGDAITALLELAQQSCSRGGTEGGAWTRDELHER